LGARLEVHPQVDVQPSLAGLRRVAIGVNEEQVDAASSATAATAAPAASAAGPVQQLAAVRAHGILRHARHELLRAAIAQPIAVQHTAAPGTAPAAASGARFEVEHRALGSGLELGVLPC